MSDLVCVGTFLSKHEAVIAKGCLESQGVDAMINSDDCGGGRPGMSFLTGIKLLVRAEDREKAVEILGRQ